MTRSSRARRNSGEAGFTLLETICALAIVALVAAVALPAIPRGTSRPRLEALTVATAALLIEDRDAALRRGESVTTQLDGVGRRVRSGASGRLIQFPADVAFDAALPETCEGRDHEGVIVFLPNGLSCGGVIALRHADAAYEIRVNWLTGVVEVVPGRHF